MRSFEWFMSWRYLFSRERRALVSVITLISMAGVAIGVAALIVVLGVMDGADDLLFGQITDFTPHLTIANGLEPGHTDAPELLESLRAEPGVLFAEPIVNKLTILQASGGIETAKFPAQLIGIDKLGKDTLYGIEQRDGRATELGPREIMLGWPLMVRLGLKKGDRILLVSTNPVATAVGPRVKNRWYTVKDSFQKGFYEFDANTAFVNNEEIRDLYRIKDGGYDYIHVKLKEPFEAEALKAKLLDVVPYGYGIQTWGDRNGDFFAALQLEKYALFLILMLIIIVAGFNIIGTLIMMVSEKTREIGILKAVGASERLIWRIFLINGVMIGLVGTVVGVVTGVIICLIIPLIEFPMPASVYNFNSLPVTIKPLTVTLIVLSSMAICTLAALFPAMQAARLKPVEALRYD